MIQTYLSCTESGEGPEKYRKKRRVCDPNGTFVRPKRKIADPKMTQMTISVYNVQPKGKCNSRNPLKITVKLTFVPLL